MEYGNEYNSEWEFIFKLPGCTDMGNIIQECYVINHGAWESCGMLRIFAPLGVIVQNNLLLK